MIVFQCSHVWLAKLSLFMYIVQSNYTHFIISYQSQGFILLQQIKLRIFYDMKNQIVLCKYIFFYILKSDIIRNSNIFIYMYKSWQETVKYIHPFVIDSRSFTPYLITCHPTPRPNSWSTYRWCLPYMHQWFVEHWLNSPMLKDPNCTNKL